MIKVSSWMLRKPFKHKSILKITENKHQNALGKKSLIKVALFYRIILEITISYSVNHIKRYGALLFKNENFEKQVIFFQFSRTMAFNGFHII